MRSDRQAATRMAMLLGLLVVGLLAMPSVSLAARKPPPQPLQDAVTGSGTATFFGAFTFDVRSGPSGEDATGQVSADSIVGLLAGPVTCLAVRGNVATMNVQTSSMFGQVTFQVTDTSATGTADVIRATDIPPRPASDCSPLDTAVPGAVLTGDIVVVDAPPLPASKDQCKNGAWAQFGFKNQGQCVAFVQRGPKP